MKHLLWIRLLFIFVGAVEFVVGALFVLFPGMVFAFFKIPMVNRIEYLELLAFLIMVFGLMMLNIAADPTKNRNLILYCILFKAAVCSVALYNWIMAGLPWLFISFFFFDLVYLMLFTIALRVIPHPPSLE